MYDIFQLQAGIQAMLCKNHSLLGYFAFICACLPILFAVL